MSADDVWVLTPDEVADLLEGASTPGSDEIHERVLLRAAQATLTPPPFLGSPPSPPPDSRLFPEPVGRFVGAFSAFLGAKFGEHEGDAVGVGDQPVTGRAVVALTPGDALERIEPGDVLVTGYTTPAFNVVMPILAGVVTSSGGANSHTAVVARELGIPAVIGLADALDRVGDGATVTVDPVAATVTVLA
jgi:pyruvate,water dikinase